MKIKNSKGFTLIELLIVVAIIAILAAIAIPQFAAYRTRGYNSAANSDVRNLATAEEALYADSQGYGQLDTTPSPGTTLKAGTPAAGAKLNSGPMNGATQQTNGGFVFNESGAVPFSISNKVTIGTSLALTAVAPIMGSSYVIMSKHVNGDACYGRDSDSTALYRSSPATNDGKTILATVIQATTGKDDVTGQTSGLCTSAFTVL